ncbi:MAG TPA: hypothetical protein VM492_16820 [Sumerlaeia bacterium]|nr:hypothetical protein [Sumerlaeia bacterium]
MCERCGTAALGCYLLQEQALSPFLMDSTGAPPASTGATLSNVPIHTPSTRVREKETGR